MRAIITVVGKDQVGIIASVCGEISQTILQDYFTMVMLVDVSKCTIPFAQLAQELADSGKERSLDIRVQREDIFNAMHRI